MPFEINFYNFHKKAPLLLCKMTKSLKIFFILFVILFDCLPAQLPPGRQFTSFHAVGAGLIVFLQVFFRQSGSNALPGFLTGFQIPAAVFREQHVHQEELGQFGRNGA